MMPVKGKVVVITGAASGIGAALAHALAAQGARLLLADVDLERLEAVAQGLRAQGASCLTQECDVARFSAMEALAERALHDFGGADILINNAGVALVAPLDSLALADARWLIDINFWGVVHGCRAFAPQLQSRPDTSIVNLSSVFAMISLPTQSIYNASKAAVRAFSDALREELRQRSDFENPGDPPAAARHAVRVLCVHPGGIRTRLVEQARLGDISSVADSPQRLHAQFQRMARTSADEAAAAILGALQDRSTRLLIGADAHLGDLLYRLFPGRASAWLFSLARWGRQRRSRARQ